MSCGRNRTAFVNLYTVHRVLDCLAWREPHQRQNVWTGGFCALARLAVCRFSEVFGLVVVMRMSRFLAEGMAANERDERE